MVKILLLIGVIFAAFVADVRCQRFNQTTFRPPRRPPLVLPTWLWQGDKIEQAPSTTVPSTPGHNRRNVRSIRYESFDDPWPQSWHPRLPRPIDPVNPRPGRPSEPHPIYARSKRDTPFPGIKKPSYHDVIIPNWNPNVRTSPWNSLGGRRKSRSLGNPGKEDEIYHDYYDVVKQEE